MLAANHKRILRNTGMLYMRMLLVMAVTLYTSRVVLAVLGVEDFGIYHVVAGFVALLGFMQGAMTTATQRYFAFDLGESGGKDLNRIFNTSLLIHLLLALVIAAVAETAGYWFVTTQLTIPDERMAAALWAYHLAIASFAVSVITVPFTAMLMAHERMGIFALIGMLDVLLKLAAVILLQFLASDKLIAYAGLLLLVSLTTLTLYITVNKLLFRQLKLRWQWHKRQFLSMIGFMAWSTWGHFAATISNQGSNVLLNIFFGPAINAGRVISMQANGALTSFVGNVQAAINPQIFKLYAKNQQAELFQLVKNGSKYNFYLLLLISLPVLINLDEILSLWLVIVPPYTDVFLRLVIIVSLIESLSSPFITLIQATGKIAQYQVVVSVVIAVTFPVAYFLFKAGYSPEFLLYTAIASGCIVFFVRLFFARHLTSFSIKQYIVDTGVSVAFVLAFSLLVAFTLYNTSSNGLVGLITSSALCLFLCGSFVFCFGLTKAERSFIINNLNRLRKKRLYKTTS